LLSFFAPRIANDIGPLILLIFFGMLVFGFGFVYLFIPETKGLSLEEVDELYRARVKPWQSAGWRPVALAGAGDLKAMPETRNGVRNGAEKGQQEQREDA
jgi:hypothetical protein